METFYRIRKVTICLLFIVCGLWVIDCSAEYLDLRGGEMVARTMCVKDGHKFLCVAVEFEGNTYVVLVDQKGEHSIYLVTEEGAKLLWARDMV